MDHPYFAWRGDTTCAECGGPIAVHNSAILSETMSVAEARRRFPHFSVDKAATPCNTTPMKKVICDLDGVLAEFNQPAHDVLSAHCAMTPLPPDGPAMWHWFALYGATDDAIGALKREMKTYDFWRSLPLHADMDSAALRAAEDLAFRTELSFVTARPAERIASIAWIAQHFDLPARRIQVTLTPVRKELALVAMAPDIVIEDNVECLLALADYEQLYALPRSTKLLVDRPYNRTPLTHNGSITRVATTAIALQMALGAVKE